VSQTKTLKLNPGFVCGSEDIHKMKIYGQISFTDCN